MPREEEEEQGNGSLFLIKSLTVDPEGKIAYAPFSFTPFTEFSGFDQQLLHARHFIIPISHNCPVRTGCHVPILKMRKLIREVNLHSITCLCVTAGPT